MKKRILSITLTMALCLGLFAAMPFTVSAESGALLANQTISDKYAIKADNSLWDIKAGKKVADGVRSTGFISLNNSEGCCYYIKTDDTLWALAFTENSYVSGNVKHPSEKLMDNVRTAVFTKYNSSSGFLVIKNDDTLWHCGDWMRNSPGDLVKRVAPQKIMDNVSSVLYNVWWDEYIYVIKTDGSLWGWGDNERGELGIGTTERQNSPVKIMDGVASFSFSLNWQGSTAGTGGTAYAVKTDGTLWGWGHNVYCQLGICDTENRLSPVKIMDGVISVDANHGHASAVKSDGTLWTWGRILGASHSIYDYNPYPIKIADNVKSIVCNPWADYFIKNDNSLWYRGGGISSDPVLYTADPLKFMDNVAYVYPQSAHAFAITLDNALWIWGTDITWKFGINAGDAAKYPVTPIKFTDGVKLPTAATQTTTPPPISTLTAKPTSSTVLVNGENIAFDAYNINGNNYFKLRDLAYILSGTGKQFEVSWDGVNNAIVLTSGKPYTTVGGEMTGKGAGDKTPTPTNSKIIMDGKEIQFTAYNIEGNNYFKLRDIGAAFDFGVDWDVANNTIVIDTSKDYTPEE